MSKGSSPRPLSVSTEEFDNKFDAIFGQKPKKEQYIPPPPLPEVEKKKKIVQSTVMLNV